MTPEESASPSAPTYNSSGVEPEKTRTRATTASAISERIISDGVDKWNCAEHAASHLDSVAHYGWLIFQFLPIRSRRVSLLHCHRAKSMTMMTLMAYNSHEICRFRAQIHVKCITIILYTHNHHNGKESKFAKHIDESHTKKHLLPPAPAYRVHLCHTCQIRNCSRCLRTERRIDFSTFQLLLMQLLLLLRVRVRHYLPDLDTMRTGYFVGIRAGVKEKDGYRVHVGLVGERGDHRKGKEALKSREREGLRGTEIRN